MGDYYPALENDQKNELSRYNQLPMITAGTSTDNQLPTISAQTSPNYDSSMGAASGSGMGSAPAMAAAAAQQGLGEEALKQLSEIYSGAPTVMGIQSWLPDQELLYEDPAAWMREATRNANSYDRVARDQNSYFGDNDSGGGRMNTRGQIAGPHQRADLSGVNDWITRTGMDAIARGQQPAPAPAQVPQGNPYAPQGPPLEQPTLPENRQQMVEQKPFVAQSLDELARIRSNVGGRDPFRGFEQYQPASGSGVSILQGLATGLPQTTL